MKNFIDNTIDFEEFEIAFSLLYRKTREECNMFNIDLKQIEKFQPSPTDIYPDVSIREIHGRVYHCKGTNRAVVIHTELS